MLKRWTLLVALLIGIAGCATQEDFLNSKQDAAIETATQRGKFELQCSRLSAEVLSRQDVDNVWYGRWGGRHGANRAEFTIGVNGCGVRRTYVVTCVESGEGCFAHPGSGRLRDE